MNKLYGQSWKEQGRFFSTESVNRGSNESPNYRPKTPGVTVIDMRSSEDFNNGHLLGANNITLAMLTAETPSPFEDVEVIQTQWKILKAMCDENGELGHISSTTTSGSFVMLCYNGETSRLATAVMRAQGVRAYSVRGGMTAIRDFEITIK